MFPLLAIVPLFLTIPFGATIFGVPPWLPEVDGVEFTLIDGVGIEFEFGQLLTLVGFVPLLVVTTPVNCNLPESNT